MISRNFFYTILSICILSTFVLIQACTKQNEGRRRLLLDVPGLVNKTSAEVEQKIGKPDSIYQEYGARPTKADIFYYEDHGKELYFYQDTLKEIVIHEPKPVEFSPEYIVYLNIYPKVKPDYYHEDVVISWGNLPEYHEVKLFTQTIDSVRKVWDYKIFVNAK